MHVPGFKTGLCEGRGHFGLGIHTLFTQHRNLRPHVTGMNVRSARMLFRIKGGLDKHPLMVGAAGDFRFPVGALRIVAAARDFVRNLAPNAHQIRALFVNQDILAARHLKGIRGVDAGNHKEAVRQPRRCGLRLHVFEAVSRNLHHSADFIVKERGGCGFDVLGAVNQAVKRDVKAHVRGKHHFRERCRQAAVASVVISGEAARKRQLTDELN